MAEEVKNQSVSALKSMFEQKINAATDNSTFKPKPLVSSLQPKPQTQPAPVATQKEAPKKIDANNWMKKDSPDNSPKNAFAAVKLTSAPAPKKLDSPFLQQAQTQPAEVKKQPEPVKAPVITPKPVITPAPT